MCKGRCDGYMSKPIDRRELFNVLQRYLLADPASKPYQNQGIFRVKFRKRLKYVFSSLLIQYIKRKNDTNNRQTCL